MAAAPDTVSELLLPPVSPATVSAAVRLQPVADEDTAFAQAVDAAEEAVAAGDVARAVDALAEHGADMGGTTPLAVRALFACSSAHLELGDVDTAVSLLTRARTVTERPGFTDVDRAEALYRLACCRLAVNAIVNALSLLTHALDLCDRSILSCDRLRVDILDRRSRCYQRQRDWAAARADVERALELSQQLADKGAVAQLFFQASIVAERERQWLLARFYAEQAFETCERLGDVRKAARVLNNLAGLAFLLGDPDEAKEFARRAHAAGAEAGDDLACGYALSSLAQIHLRVDEVADAETQARRALELLADRPDHLPEVGSAQLVLARALEALDRAEEADSVFDAAEATMEAVSSSSHLCAVWLARGDALAARGDIDAAAALYRRSAEKLQDLHF